MSKILTIFCDASIKNIYENGVKKYTGCAGAIAVDHTGHVMDKSLTLLYDTTNNESELLAIYNGIMLANKYRESYDTINLYSDSLISIHGLTRWIYNWKIIGNKFYGSNNKLIANQELIVHIVKFLLDNDMTFLRMYHQKGHVNVNRMDHINEAINVFAESNYIVMQVKDIVYLSHYNNVIDDMTRTSLYQWEFNPNSKLVFPINNIKLKDLDLKKYKLITSLTKE